MGYAIKAELEKEMDGNARFHRWRYHMAAGFIDKEDNVLDLGSGTGYGTDILSGHAKYVTGIDMYEADVKSSISNHAKPNNCFIHADLETYDLPECNVAVMFEVLEHLKEPGKFAEKLKSKAGKYIIMSVPLFQELVWDEDRKFFHEKGDHTHLSVFPNRESFVDLFVDEKWKIFFEIQMGVTCIAIFYNKESI